MSNIVGNYFRLSPLTESRALRTGRGSGQRRAVDWVETGPESGNPTRGGHAGWTAAARIGG